MSDRGRKEAKYFSHLINLRNLPEMKRMGKKFGKDGVLFSYYMFELLTGSKNFRIRFNGTTADDLAIDFEHFDEDDIKNMLKFGVEKGLFSLHETEEGQYLSSEFLEAALLSDLLSKRQSTKKAVDAYRKRQEEKKAKEKKPGKEVIKSEHPLLIHIEKNYPRVSKMQEPLTEEQASELIKKYRKPDIDRVLKAMQNHKPLLSKNISANLTIQNWLNRNIKDPAPGANTEEDVKGR